MKDQTFRDQPIFLVTFPRRAIWNICPGHVASLTRNPRCSVPRLALYSFYQPQTDGRMTELCSRPLDLQSGSQLVLTTKPLGLQFIMHA